MRQTLHRHHHASTMRISQAEGTLVCSVALASTESCTLTANSRLVRAFSVGHAVAGVGVLAVVLVTVVGSLV